MRAKQVLVGASLMAAVAACSSGESPRTLGIPVNVPAPGSVAPTPSTHAIAFFQGSVDIAKGTMDVVWRSLKGEVIAESKLPYGTAAGDVYFHTCSASFASHQLTGSVQAVNLMSGPVTGMNAVISSISLTGVTLASGPGSGSASGVIAQYGSVAVNTANCGSALQTWKFNDPTDGNFTFGGYADGTGPSGGGDLTVDITQPLMTGQIACGSGDFYGCPGNDTLGFHWTDTGGKAPKSFTMTFSEDWGNCGPTGPIHVILNGTDIGTIAESSNSCSCGLTTRVERVLNTSVVSSFVKSGTNSVLMLVTGSQSCASLNADPALGNDYVKIVLHY